MNGDRAALLSSIEAHFREGFSSKARPRDVERWLAYELESVGIHRKNLVPFVQGHGARRGHTLLDFGSGPGASACAMAMELGVRVIGVEPNLSNARVAPLWAKYCGVEDRVEFHFTQDTLRLPCADASVDFVLASSVLEYIPGDRGPYVREMWRVLKPGGRLLIAGTSNAAYPREVHSKTWLVNWMPNLGPRLRAGLGRNPNVERGVTFGGLEAALPGARFVRGASDELDAFARRLSARAPVGQPALAAGIKRALGFLDRRSMNAVGWPAEAFLPWLNVAFEKTVEGPSATA